MSHRECIQVFNTVDIQAYLGILKDEFGAKPHPHQPDAFLVGDPPLPFYQPQVVMDHLSILSFNYWPLSISLVQALISHPELASKTTKVRWTAEQELIIEGTLQELKKLLEEDEL